MIKIIHRVNTIEALKGIPIEYGVEIDVRGNEGQLVLGHDFGIYKDKFDEFIKHFQHKLLVVNIKEAGVEQQVLNSLKKKSISNFFLLDIEFPYLLQNHEHFGNYLSLRFSKFESVYNLPSFTDKVKWVWVDTYKDFDLDSESADILRNFQLCLVSPSRWGFENKMNYYIEKFAKYEIVFDAVMVDKSEVSI